MENLNPIRAVHEEDRRRREAGEKPVSSIAYAALAFSEMLQTQLHEDNPLGKALRSMYKTAGVKIPEDTSQSES